jgi:hypothetical protein
LAKTEVGSFPQPLEGVQGLLTALPVHKEVVGVVVDREDSWDRDKRGTLAVQQGGREVAVDIAEEPAPVEV